MTDMDILEKAGEYRLVLKQDTDASSPREDQDCNLANVITHKGQRCLDVDEDGGPLEEGWRRIESRYVNAFPVFARWARIFHGATAVEQWPHGGARSLWYVMPGKLAETTVSAEKIIEEEVEEYRKWVNGEVYGYVIEKSVGWQRSDGGVGVLVTWEGVESCWGHIGREYAEEAAREAFAPYAEEAGK